MLVLTEGEIWDILYFVVFLECVGGKKVGEHQQAVVAQVDGREIDVPREGILVITGTINRPRIEGAKVVGEQSLRATYFYGPDTPPERVETMASLKSGKNK